MKTCSKVYYKTIKKKPFTISSRYVVLITLTKTRLGDKNVLLKDYRVKVIHHCG